MQEPQSIFSDGCLDKVSYTQEEVEQMQDQEWANREEQTRGLNQLPEEEDNTVEEVIKEVRVAEHQQPGPTCTNWNKVKLLVKATLPCQTETCTMSTNRESDAGGRGDCC
ncbi:hypothetical protein ACA910_013185 [Epithemia clementina (nom. ined.)]